MSSTATTPARRIRRHVSVRPATFDDYPAIAALHQRNRIPIRPLEQWRAMWTSNPAYNTSRPIGWLLEDATGHITGSISSIPSHYSFGGRLIIAAAAAAWVVDEEFRSSSLALFDAFNRQPAVDLLITTSASPKSESTLILFGWRPAPAGSWNRVLDWGVDRRGLARFAMDTKRVPCSTALSWPVSAALACRDAFFSLRSLPRASRAPVQQLHAFDERFDEFYGSLCAARPRTLLARRDSAALSAHFQGALAAGQCFILATPSGGSLASFSVFVQHDDSERGLRRLRLVDFQSLPGFEPSAGAHIRRAISLARARSTQVLEMVGSWLPPQLLNDLPPFYSRALSSHLFYYRAASSDLALPLEDPARWAPTSLDGDASR